MARNIAELERSLDESGHISTRAIDRHAYAHDASHFSLLPDAIVVAKDSAEVARLLFACTTQGIPLTFRSGGTSLSGQGVTNSVLVDVRRNFRRIEVLDGGAKVRVQPGATVRQVNARLAQYGRRLGPDPASEVACTIGGVIANNSSGMSCGTTANTYRTLDSMVVVLPSGTILDTSAPDADARLQRHEPELYQGLLALRDRVRSNTSSVRTLRQQFSMKNTMGYGLNSFLDYDTAAAILTHLVIGSEGTLGFVAQAVFNTVPLHKYASTGLLIFHDLHAASEALPALIDTGAAALELMDALSLRVAQNSPDAHLIVRDLEVRNHAALLIEYQASSAAELADYQADGIGQLQRLNLAKAGILTTDAATRASLWHLRKGLYAMVAEARPSGTTALLEDVVVPVESLAHTCAELLQLFDRHGYQNSVIFGHAKDGNIHFMLTDRFGDAAPLSRYASFTEDMVELILGQSGSLKAEHGTGRVMAPYVRRQYGDELYSVMQEVKRLFDPRGVLNPGVLLDEDPKAHLANIKTTPTIEKEVDRCVECGYCEPVCPSRDLTLTPRQRIVVKRAIKAAESAGEAELARELGRDYLYAAVQTCAVDGMCQTACPVQINTGDLIKRLRTQDQRPASSKTWKVLAKNWPTTTLAASAALSVAAALPSRVVLVPNRLARTIVGEEVLPMWSPELPRGGKRRARTTSAKEPQAVYMPACVNSIFGPAGGGLGVQRSFEILCERVGLGILVPANIDSLCCATPWSSKGLPAGAAIMGARVIAALREATRNGEIPVICDASSCTEGILRLLQEDTQEPKIIVIDAVEFTAGRILELLGEPQRLNSLVIHPTCSSTRIGTNSALSRVAGAVAHTVYIPDDWGCCAFAGDRGLLHPELTASATHAQAANISEIGADAHASCNRTCELGMTRATGKQYRHVLELLEEATRS